MEPMADGLQVVDVHETTKDSEALSCDGASHLEDEQSQNLLDACEIFIPCTGLFFWHEDSLPQYHNSLHSTTL